MRKLKNKCGSMYVEHCVGLVAILLVVVLSLEVFSLFTLRVQMDRIAEDLLESATYSGCFGDEFEARAAQLRADHFDFDLNYGADAWFNSTYERVQLGSEMWVEITVSAEVSSGAVDIPITVTVRKSGLSERYWKETE